MHWEEIDINLSKAEARLIRKTKWRWKLGILDTLMLIIIACGIIILAVLFGFPGVITIDPFVIIATVTIIFAVLLFLDKLRKDKGYLTSIKGVSQQQNAAMVRQIALENGLTERKLTEEIAVYSTEPKFFKQSKRLVIIFDDSAILFNCVAMENSYEASLAWGPNEDANLLCNKFKEQFEKMVEINFLQY